jgi:hypothetical protein
MKQQSKSSSEYSSKPAVEESEHSKLNGNQNSLEQIDEAKLLRDELNEKNKVLFFLNQLSLF